MIFFFATLLAAALPLALTSRILGNGSLDARDSAPRLPYHKSTTPYCSFWYDHDGSMSCDEILSMFSLSLANFLQWNPAVDSACSNLPRFNSYCVEAAREVQATINPKKIPTTSWSTSPTMPDKHGLTRIVKKRLSAGIETPTPTQPGLVDNCNKFYLVKRGDQCAEIAVKNSITLEEFLIWNPKAGKNCTALWAEAFACVSVIGYKPQPTTSEPGGVQTPMPIMPGLVSNCDRFQFVNPGDSCVIIAKKSGISVADFVRWNPQVGGSCQSLWANTYACVGVVPAFRLKTRYHADCTGNVYRGVSVEAAAGQCVNTGCSAASLEIAAQGLCPDGQVQISYWEHPDCAGKWFGYGYTGRGKCHGLWTEGWKFKSLHLRCAKRKDDCVSKGTCKYDVEPAQNVC